MGTKVLRIKNLVNTEPGHLADLTAEHVRNIPVPDAHVRSPRDDYQRLLVGRDVAETLVNWRIVYEGEFKTVNPVKTISDVEDASRARALSPATRAH